MKSLVVKSSSFNYIEKGFKEWLNVLGYANQTVYHMPNYVRGLLHYIEQQGKTEVRDISKELIKEYYHSHLRQRENKLYKSGGLSNTHLNKHLQAMYKFCDYLRQTGRIIIPALNIRLEKSDTPIAKVLTEEEMEQLYMACDLHPTGSTHNKSSWFYPAMALRDKAMLSIYYGCGLRSNEGLHIELNDIFWDKQILYVRKGKNYKERLVPISKLNAEYLKQWIYDYRNKIVKDKKEHRLFIGLKNEITTGGTLYSRLQLLQQQSENIELEELPENERKKKKVEFVYFTFSLFGEVTPLEYSVSPTFWRAPLALPITHKNEARFTIRNYSKSEGRFLLKQDSISNENLLSLIKGVYRSNLVPDKLEQPDSSPVRYV